MGNSVQGRKTAPSLGQAPAGLVDMMASALRGATKQTLGLPGDLESLGRMGINAVGGNVSPESVLPNTKDMDRHLPPMTPISDTTTKSWSPMEDLGGLIPLSPAAGMTKSTAMAQALRGTDQGRRGALKTIGAVTASPLTVPAIKAGAKAGSVRAAMRQFSHPLDDMRNVHPSWDDEFAKRFTPEELNKMSASKDTSWMTPEQRKLVQEFLEQQPDL